MRGDADGFVDDHHVVVLVDDREAGHLDRGRRAVVLAFRLGDRDLQPGACGQLVRLARRAAVEAHVTGLGDRGHGRAGQAQQLRQARVDPHPVQSVRHGEGSLRHFFSLLSAVRLPS
jgi:hypothetical protein